MSKKLSIFGRIAQLGKANVNSAIDSAEDPQKMLDQMVRDFTNNIAEAEQSVAQSIGNLRMLEADHKADLQDAADWGRKALAASAKGDQFRAAGDAANAAKFDNLAKVALQHQIREEGEARALEATIASQNQIVEKLKTGLDSMKRKRAELVAQRDQLVARARNASAQNQMLDSVKSIDLTDPASEVGRFEEKIRREEARALGAAELAASSLDSQFEALEDLGEMSEVEARLAALKAAQEPKQLDG
ncbi:PspA/IM30 family protein [Arthrobacter halodurans]|uniref:PspA/IM30 family protein n=1 Tax=Arthrobacter halodurans TaxID=516699 RepID=A0ABV4USX4_9MICC